jgi:hypothetical protein
MKLIKRFSYNTKFYDENKEILFKIRNENFSILLFYNRDDNILTSSVNIIPDYLVNSPYIHLDFC